MEAEVAVPAPAPVLAPVPAGPSYPAGTFRPGRVVWAKVEGHEWWPAKVVRRRAVPRDVAEPPGGKMLVKLFIPVIFFTAQGIPGELKSCEDRLGAALAASAHSGAWCYLHALLFLQPSVGDSAHHLMHESCSTG